MEKDNGAALCFLAEGYLFVFEHTNELIHGKTIPSVAMGRYQG